MYLFPETLNFRYLSAGLLLVSSSVTFIILFLYKELWLLLVVWLELVQQMVCKEEWLVYSIFLLSLKPYFSLYIYLHIYLPIHLYISLSLSLYFSLYLFILKISPRLVSSYLNNFPAFSAMKKNVSSKSLFTSLSPSPQNITPPFLLISQLPVVPFHNEYFSIA